MLNGKIYTHPQWDHVHAHNAPSQGQCSMLRGAGAVKQYKQPGSFFILMESLQTPFCSNKPCALCFQPTQTVPCVLQYAHVSLTSVFVGQNVQLLCCWTESVAAACVPQTHCRYAVRLLHEGGKHYHLSVTADIHWTPNKSDPALREKYKCSRQTNPDESVDNGSTIFVIVYTLSCIFFLYIWRIFMNSHDRAERT